MKKTFLLSLLVLFIPFLTSAQCDRWQQHIDVSMSVDLNVEDHQFTGKQSLVYTNNSPDVLTEVYYHLFFNAFKPGSEMDVRSLTIADPDSRVGDRISKLKPEEYGHLEVLNFKQGKASAKLEHRGTVLKVLLPTPIKPGGKSTFSLEFKGQVPIQIRRSGRDNKEGVAYTMTQWYPKIAEYDHRGWHADPYVGREFYGVWGNYDVKISLDSRYTVASTGTIQNPGTVGHGYATKDVEHKEGTKLNWHFKAKNVHDFAWAADPDYVHTTYQVPEGPLLRFFRKDDDKLAETWDQLPEYMSKAFLFMNENFGKYPYSVYNFVQGGDGGMEYPMLTMITGKRRLGSLVGVSVHEFVHSWYYGLMGSNESRFPWMDEGFTQYASSITMDQLFPPKTEEDPHNSAYQGYFRLVDAGKDEPMSTHGDHYTTNFAYGVNAYNKGEMFVAQLRGVVGDKTVSKALKSYYDACKFKHPEPIDVERVFEKESGVHLDWYFDEWINTTRTLDYAVTGIWEVDGKTIIHLTNKGGMIMPVDLVLVDKSGEVNHYHIPLSLMLAQKPDDSEAFSFSVAEPWLWTHPEYELVIDQALKDISSVEIDPYGRLADVDRGNDVLEIPAKMGGVIRR